MASGAIGVANTANVLQKYLDDNRNEDLGAWNKIHAQHGSSLVGATYMSASNIK